MNTVKYISAISTIGALLLLLQACAAVTSAGQKLGLLPINPLATVHIAAAADANQSSVTQLDLVWVLSATALGQLPKSGPQWFAAKAALLAGRPADLLVLPLQVPVGSAQQDLGLPKGHDKAVAVLVYANHLAAAGQPVATITSFKCLLIEVQASTINYLSCP